MFNRDPGQFCTGGYLPPTRSTEFIAGKGGEPAAKTDIYEQLDEESVPKLLASIQDHGVPRIQVVYFPGIDLYTHVIENPLPSDVDYIEKITDPLVAKILNAYQGYGVLDQTYVVVIADHGHTPVLKDEQHALGANPDSGPAAVVKAAGFRPRKFVLTPAADQQDYQAVFAYQGAIAYVYLADRSTCRNPGATCDWKRPPRFKQDVLPAARAFYSSNKRGKPTPVMKNTLDLIFARVPTAPGEETKEYEIFDGRKLVPIREYLMRHPRPDLPSLGLPRAAEIFEHRPPPATKRRRYSGARGGINGRSGALFVTRLEAFSRSETVKRAHARTIT